MTKDEFNLLYNKKFVGLTKEEERKLDQILKKIEFTTEEKRILDAFYMPRKEEEFSSIEMISPLLMKAELRNIFLLLKYNYSGYDYFNRNNELEKIQEKLKNHFSLINEPIKTLDFFTMIMNELHVVIKDNHFSLVCNNQIFHTSINMAPYFSDLILEKTNNNYVVVNDNPYFSKGYVVKDVRVNNLFETLSIQDNRAYLVGIFQDMKNPVLEIVIDGITLPLHLSKSVHVRFDQKNEIRHYDKYDMIVLKKCHVNEELSLDKYFEWGKELKNGDCAVISVVDNPGGSSNVCSQIIRGLNTNGIWSADGSTINLYQKTGIPYKYYTYGSNSSNGEGTYDKTLYVLMNKYTASAGESLVSISNNVKKVIKVGTNTMGCGCFGEVISYVLPQTHATINLPCKAFFMEGFNEGNGFMPDIWMDDENMIEIFTKWLNKKTNK